MDKKEGNMRHLILTEEEWNFLKAICEWEEDHIYDYDYEYEVDGEIFINKIKNASKYK